MNVLIYTSDPDNVDPSAIAAALRHLGYLVLDVNVNDGERVWSPRLQERLRKAADEVATQRQWIADHGGSLAGYIARYGSAQDEHRHGDGGEAIYAADTAALSHAEEVYESLAKALGGRVVADRAVRKR